MYNFDDEPEPVKRDKNLTLGIIIKIFAIVLIILSIILLIYGLIPHDRVETTHAKLTGGVACYKGIPANKGDIMVVDFTVEDNYVSFYLTYGEAWCDGNYDYLEKKEHVRSGHIEINIEKSGEYFLNFESNNPSSPSFNVDLSYKIMDRYSPLHIILGAITLATGLILTIIFLWLKKKPTAIESEYIRL